MKRPSSKPSPRKHGGSNTQTTTSQTAYTNWTDKNRLFCSGWEQDTTDLMPTYTTSSKLASLRCAHAMQTSWQQNTYCSTVNCMMLWGGTCGLNQRYWGTSSMATWRSWGGQPPSWGQQASPSSVRRRRRMLSSDCCHGTNPLYRCFLPHTQCLSYANAVQLTTTPLPISGNQVPVSWRPTTVKWRQFSQSNRHSTIGTRQTEYHEALPSLANVQSHLTSSFANDGNSVCRAPMVVWRLDCENCCYSTVIGLHDTGPRYCQAVASLPQHSPAHLPDTSNNCCSMPVLWSDIPLERRSLHG